ncbi:hypothetical protein BST61_g2233 [Cercospora zeina]
MGRRDCRKSKRSRAWRSSINHVPGSAAIEYAATAVGSTSKSLNPFTETCNSSSLPLLWLRFLLPVPSLVRSLFQSRIMTS